MKCQRKINTQNAIKEQDGGGHDNAVMSECFDKVYLVIKKYNQFQQLSFPCAFLREHLKKMKQLKR